MFFFHREQDFFEQYNLSCLLSWQGFFYFEDIFYLDKEDLLNLYYLVPLDTFALAMKNLAEKYKKILFSLIDKEEKEKLLLAIKNSSGDSDKARKDIEQEFKDGMFFHREFRCSKKLTERKICQIVRFISLIPSLFTSNNIEKLKPLKNIPFWISAKIMDLLPYSIAIKYLELLEEGQILSREPCPQLPPPYIETFTEGDFLPEEFLDRAFFLPLNINFLLKSSFHSYIDRGRAFLASNEYLSAITFLSKACSLSPDDFLSNWSYAITLYKIGKREDALSHYNLALKKKSLLKKYYIFTGYSLRAGGHISKAIEELQMLTCLSPDYPYGFKLLGHLYMINGDFSGAIDCFTHSLKLMPDDIVTYLELIDCYIEENDMKNAEDMALKSIEFCEKDFHRAKVYFKLGEIYKSEDKEKARGFYKKSIELQQDYYPSLTSLGFLELSSGNKEAAGELLAKSVFLQPKATWLRKTLAEIYLGRGETELALKELSAITGIYPDDPFALEKMKEIHNKEKRVTEEN